MLRRRRYAIIGNQEILIAKDSRWEIFSNAFKTIIKNKTIIDLNKEYFGQKEVWLARGRAFDDNVAPKEKTVKNWIEYLSSNPTRIETLRLCDANQKLIDVLQFQPQITTLKIAYGGRNYRDLSVLGELPRLRELEIEGFPAEASLEGLAKSESLRVLRVFSRKALDFNPLSKLERLEELEIGTGIDPAFRGTVKVPNLKFLNNLTQLKHLELRLVPEDKDLTPLLGLTNLKTGWYMWFRGQNPSVEELSSVNEVFAEVYKTYLDHVSTKFTDEIPIITKWKWGLK